MNQIIKYSTLKEVNDAFLEEFYKYLKENNLQITSEETAKNHMKTFLKVKLNPEEEYDNLIDTNPDLAIWAYLAPSFQELLPVHDNQLLTILISNNLNRISAENPEFLKFIESQIEEKEIENEEKNEKHSISRRTFVKASLIAAAGIFLAGRIATDIIDSNNESTNQTPKDSIETIAYKDYIECKKYIESIVEQVNSESEEAKTIKTEFSRNVAATIPLMGLLDSQAILNDDFSLGLNADGYTASVYAVESAVEFCRIDLTYMLENHPNEIVLSNMVLGNTDKTILDELQSKYNEVLTAEDEVKCKRALFDLSEYEINNCGTDGITHIIGNVMVSLAVPYACSILREKNGWDLIEIVQNDDNYTPAIVNGVYQGAIKQEQLNQITMIDSAANKVIGDSADLTAEDIKQIANGTFSGNIEGKGRFSYLSSNPQTNARFGELATKLGLSTAPAMVA